MSVVLKCLIEGVQGIVMVKGDKDMNLFEILRPHIPEDITPDKLFVKREKESNNLSSSSSLSVTLPLSLIHVNNGETLEVSFKIGQPLKKVRVKIISRHPQINIPPKIITVPAREMLYVVLKDNIPLQDLSNVSVQCMTRCINSEMFPSTSIASLCGSSDSLALTLVENKGIDMVHISHKSLDIKPTPNKTSDNSNIDITITTTTTTTTNNEEKKKEEGVKDDNNNKKDEGIEEPEIIEVDKEDVDTNNNNNQNIRSKEEDECISIDNHEEAIDTEAQPTNTSKYNNMDNINTLSLLKQMKEEKMGQTNTSVSTTVNNIHPQKREYIPPDETFRTSTPQSWDDDLIRSLVASARMEMELDGSVPRLASIDPSQADPFELTAQDLVAISIAKKNHPTAAQLEKMSRTRRMGDVTLKINDTTKDNKESFITIKPTETCNTLYSLLIKKRVEYISTVSCEQPTSSTNIDPTSRSLECDNLDNVSLSSPPPTMNNNEETMVEDKHLNIFIMTIHGWKLLPRSDTTLWNLGVEYNSRIVISEHSDIIINKFKN